MCLTSWASSWCRQFTAGRQHVHDKEYVDHHLSLRTTLWSLCRNAFWRIISGHFPQISCSLLYKIVTDQLLLRKLCARWVPKQLTPEHKAKHMESALAFLQRCHDDGDEFLDQIVTRGETKQQSMHWHHSGSPCKTKFMQTLSAWKVVCMVFSSTSWPEVRQWMPSVIAKHCRNCDGPFRTSGTGCLMLVLSCCMITLGHKRLDGQQISFRSSAGRCFIIHPIARTSCPVISIFSYTSRNSCPVRVFRMRERQKCVSDSGSNPRQKISTT